MGVGAPVIDGGLGAASGSRHSRRGGIPHQGQLARVMHARALAAEAPIGWVAGDTVYGNDRRLRWWREEQEIPYVLAVKSNEPLWADMEDSAAPVAVRRLAQQIPDDQWPDLTKIR